MSTSNQTTQNSFNVLPTTKTKEAKVKKIFKSISYNLVTTIISSAYSLVWGIIITIFSENKSHTPNCKTLLHWNRALYICLYTSTLFTFICGVIQICLGEKNDALNSKLLFIRSCFHYVVGYVLVIGITVVYFDTKDVDLCDKMRKADLGYIICEWVIMGGCTIGFLTIVIYLCCCKAKHKEWNGVGDVDEEEIRKVVKIS